MKVQNTKLSDIKPYENNPRINDNAVDKVAKSIEEFGFQQPIVVDKTHVIIIGHTQYKASQKLGLQEVPVVVADMLSDEQVKAYRLADNKTNEFAEWDYGLLNIELGDILDIDMSDFGFAENVFSDNDLENMMDYEVDARKKTEYKIEISFESEEKRQQALKELINLGYDAVSK